MIRDRVQQTTTTSGTGTLQLDGPAPSGYLAFASVFSTGATVYCCVVDGSAWEIFEGVFTTGSPPTVSRLRTLASSNGGSPVSFSGSAKQVFSDAPAELLGAMAGRLKAATTTNVSNAYSLTLPVPVAGPTLVDHMEFSARINAANSGAVTLAVNGGTAKNVRKLNGKALITGDWFANFIANFRFDATNDCYLWMNAPELGNVKTISATTYPILAEDHGVLLRFTSATGCAVTVPQALPTNAFAVPFHFDYLAQGGSVTFTPTTSQIEGGTSLTVAKGSSGQVRSDGTNYWVRNDIKGLPQRYLSGLRISNNATDAVNDIDMAAGTCRDDGDTTDLTIAATHVKQIDITFAEYSVIGTASGGRDSADNLTGAKWFRVYLIGGAGKNTQMFFSTSANPTLPSGFTVKRRRGFIYWTGTTIGGFKHHGNWFRWNTPGLDVATTTLGTTATNFTLNLPTGYRWWVMGPIATDANSAGGLHIASSEVTDSAPSFSAAPLGFGSYSSGPLSGQGWITPTTDASAQIRARADAASRTFRFSVHAWFDDASEY